MWKYQFYYQEYSNNEGGNKKVFNRGDCGGIYYIKLKIHYIVTAVYRYNPESLFGKNYNAIEECK